MAGGYTRQQLAALLEGLPWAEWTPEERLEVMGVMREANRAGFPLQLDLERLKEWEVVLVAEGFNCQFLIHKHRVPGRWLRKPREEFLLCTGRLDQDWWDVHYPSQGLASALRAVVTPFQVFQSRGLVMGVTV